MSALAWAIPIPGIGAAVDSAILINELDLYKSQSGLDCTSMDKNAQPLKTEVREQKKKLCLESVNLATTAKELIQIMSCLGSSWKCTSNRYSITWQLIVSWGVLWGKCCKFEITAKTCSDDACKINEELMKNIESMK